MAKDKLKQYSDLQRSLRNELAELEARAQEIRQALSNGSHDVGLETSPARKANKRKRGRRKGGITTTAAILECIAKQGGKADIKTIKAAVMTRKPGISDGTINQAFVFLKKRKAILNPQRGVYSLKK